MELNVHTVMDRKVRVRSARRSRCLGYAARPPIKRCFRLFATASPEHKCRRVHFRRPRSGSWWRMYERSAKWSNPNRPATRCGRADLSRKGGLRAVSHDRRPWRRDRAGSERCRRAGWIEISSGLHWLLRKHLFPRDFLQVSLVTKDGQKLTGVRVNEDSFSIQIRDLSNQFHSFWKS